MQANLIDIGNIGKENNGIKYLLTIICSFTKKAWIQPIKSKKIRCCFTRFQDSSKENNENSKRCFNGCRRRIHFS